MKRQDHRLLILLLLFHVQVLFSSARDDGVSISKGGHFPPFSSEGKPPKSVGRGSKDLTLCRVFRKRTCCNAAQTHPALLNIRRLALTGEANEECLQVYQACGGAYFSMDAKTRVLSPCGVNDFVCGKAAEWVSNGTELCHAAGFSVKESDDSGIGVEKASCYGGKASFDTIANSWRSSQSEPRQKTEKLWDLEDLHQWVLGMSFSEKVSWTVGGMVLTAGLLFVSKRKSHNHREKLTAIQVTARRLEMYQTSTDLGAHRRGNKG